MALQALRDGFPARAAAIVGAFSDLDQYRKRSTPPRWRPRSFRTTTPTAPRSSSTICCPGADRITTPLLIMHGADDTSVKPTHAMQLAAALHRSGKPYELVIAAGAKHVLDPFEAERDERAIRWFHRYQREGNP